PCLHACRASGFDRVDTFMAQPASIQGLSAGLLQLIERGRSEAHPPRPTVQHVPKHPTLRAVVGDAQIKPATVAVHARLLRFLDLERRQLVHHTRHWGPLLSAIPSTVVVRIMTKDGEPVQPPKSVLMPVKLGIL